MKWSEPVRVLGCMALITSMDLLVRVAGLRRALRLVGGAAVRRGAATPAPAVTAAMEATAAAAAPAATAAPATMAAPAKMAASAATAATANRVALAAAFYPRRALCLEQSLALCVLLRWQGVAAELRLGVQPRPFQAHAWVEVDGEPVAEHGDLPLNLVAFPRLVV